ncbi:MAG: EscR/YscR/HrcR family type III secretion system export apparatus protein [Kofleriaceae bacterium]|jgi:type III secretion protein R|nr:EscR/YscR/HrcR family type III secretion system export apparatus protein [Kofleriaceae bacterium]MBP9169052.1 EscR/YscR/HrcR family type III secretion system export apparatus protein [Kofleriaceae bacterium]MBP9858771.1 EscR/YscR/HrcR family type III secretion system export apparatus protein [Kofleriaceae bacterium]
MSGGDVAALVAVAAVPVVALMLTAFVKTTVVMALLRNALGAPQAPPDLVVTGLALLLTIFVMLPVGRDVVAAIERGPAGAPAPAGGPGGAGAPDAPAPYRLDLDQAPPGGWLAAADRGVVPVRAFLIKHAGADDRAAFAAAATELRGAPVADDDLAVLALAFVATELAEAFAIAFLVFLPFLLVDLIVGVALGALGLTTVPTPTVALPLKLLLFVAVDGWRLLFVGLIRGYA